MHIEDICRKPFQATLLAYRLIMRLQRQLAYALENMHQSQQITFDFGLCVLYYLKKKKLNKINCFKIIIFNVYLKYTGSGGKDVTCVDDVTIYILCTYIKRQGFNSCQFKYLFKQYNTIKQICTHIKAMLKLFKKLWLMNILMFQPQSRFY